ncbi:MAG: helix-turn-helix domain-containing protein [Paenibacillaceae bacterium]|nr:helix-turn-helix domain-containing protein [Paenibacillaceae bacterium]
MTSLLEKENLPLVLQADDIRVILGIGRRQTYELLQDPPFPVARIGKRGIIRVSREVFFDWIEGKMVP